MGLAAAGVTFDCFSCFCFTLMLVDYCMLSKSLKKRSPRQRKTSFEKGFRIHGDRVKTISEHQVQQDGARKYYGEKRERLDGRGRRRDVPDAIEEE